MAPNRLRAAWIVAVAADFLQIVAFPFFWQGFVSPIDDVLDVVVAAALSLLIGWRWSFLPSFLVKLTPALDLVPTWTAAMFLATRNSAVAPPVEPVEPIEITARVVRPEGGGVLPRAERRTELPAGSPERSASPPSPPAPLDP